MNKWKAHIVAGILTLAIGAGIFYIVTLEKKSSEYVIVTEPPLGAMLPFITATSSNPVSNEVKRGPSYFDVKRGKNLFTRSVIPGWMNVLTQDGWTPLAGMDVFTEVSDGFEADLGMFTAKIGLRSVDEATFTETNRWDWGLKKQINAPYISETILAEGVVDVAGIIEECLLIRRFDLAG